MAETPETSRRIEFADFPPWRGLVDAHALWHASTVPLAHAYWHAFIRRELRFKLAT